MNRIGQEQGWPTSTRAQLGQGKAPYGADFVGSPAEIIERILFQHEIFGHDRLLLQLGIGAIELHKVMRAIELPGTEVAPVVRQETASRTQAA